MLAGLHAAGRQAPAKDAGQAGRPRGQRRAGLSVLVAEDNDINAMLARATLLKAGHRVDVVGNGKAAVEAVTGGARNGATTWC